jgi:diguanylate cyclase (GGDEF)-like protein
VVELECQTRGDGRCLYSVSWDPSANIGDDLEMRCRQLETELHALTSRFEALQAVATELMTATSVDEVLGRVSRQAALAVRAPQHLLAVRVTPDGLLRVHHEGFATHDQAVAAAEELLATTEAKSNSSLLVVDVATARRHFGRLAAMYPAGSPFLPQEHRLLTAFAGHVAAALEAAAALEEARRESSRAHLLLGLGRTLADLGTPESVAERLASATSSVVDADQISVLLWDEDRACLVLAAAVGVPDEVRGLLDCLGIAVSDAPVVARILRDGEPQAVATASDDEYMFSVLDASSMHSVVLVPIARDRRFFGVVAAVFRAAVDAHADPVGRLVGMAEHAATALQNSALLAQVQRQALHDPLTGLPNPRLLEDRVNIALAGALRDGHAAAVLFLDLDGFKRVNDAHGHAVGDAVLVEASTRMQAALRAGDTVARLSGDEFVVLLAHVAEARDVTKVADKLRTLLRQPFRVGDQDVAIAVSIGSAVFPDVGAGYRDLLRHADAAMYRDKEARRTGSARGDRS